MIRHINQNEIETLKEGLMELVRVKKVLNIGKKINQFFDGDLQLKEAMQVYKSIVSAAKLNKSYDSLNEVMVHYLIEHKVLNEKQLNWLEKFTFDYRKETSEEYESKSEELDDVYENKENMEELIIELGENLGIEVKAATFSDVVLEDLNDDNKEFKFYQDETESIVSNFNTEEDIFEQYMDMFNEDATIFVFKDIKVPISDQNIINLKFGVSYGGIASEVVANGKDTFCMISDTTFTNLLSKEILLMLICILMECREVKIC